MTVDFSMTIRAVMMGHAVADALGVPVEFCSRGELDARPVTEMMGFGTYPVPAGAWSDDTSMSLAALDSLAGGEVDYNEIMDGLVLWYLQGAYTPTGKVFDIGGTCAAAIENYLTVKGRDATVCGLRDEASNGNGSLMRIHPFVLYARAKGLAREDRERLIRNGSSLTHAHPRAQLGCLIYAYVLDALLTEQTKEAVLAGLERAARELGDEAELTHYQRVLDSSLAQLPRDEIRSGGYVVDTLEAALWCLLTTDDYRSCVLKAVGLGEDTDTVAAVAGGLAGALYGYDAIPREWLDVLLRRELLEDTCARATKGWGV